MEADSSVLYQGRNESNYPTENQKRQIQQLTTEEIRVLRECNRESFYNRCMPFAFAGMAASYLAVKNGVLKGHPKWGAAGKMTAAAFAGWLIGKFSYRKICEEKFLKLENSSIADAIRKKRGIYSENFENERPSRRREDDSDLTLKDDTYQSFKNDDYFASSSGSLNLDVDKNVSYSGLDDRERPSTDRENAYSEEEERPKNITSYEELRRMNRDEFERKRYAPQQPRPDPGQSPPRSWNTRDSDRDNGKNSYGDRWDR